MVCALRSGDLCACERDVAPMVVCLFLGGGGVWCLCFLGLFGGGGVGGGRAPVPQPGPQADIRQCLSGLNRMGVSYRALPDRSYGGGCQAVGSVQLLDICVPVTNLTPVPCPLVAALADRSTGLPQLNSQKRRVGKGVVRKCKIRGDT